MSNYTIRLGGVPEHFNLPLLLALEEGLFKKAGINVVWNDFEGGTGQMITALREDICDVCILLTEGIISDILNGNPSKIISGYVKSPLIWGIHTGFESSIDNHNDVYDKRIAISRIGSGSHLMPIVDALMQDKTLYDQQFVNIQNLKGALHALNHGQADIFYWEKYTTKPYVASKQLSRIGEFASPWPCFMIAASDKIIEAAPQQLDIMLKIIHAACENFMQNPNAVNLVSQRYDIKLSDARHWFNITEWETESWVSNKMLSSVLMTLKEAKIARENATTEGFIWKRNAV